MKNTFVLSAEKSNKYSIIMGSDDSEEKCQKNNIYVENSEEAEILLQILGSKAQILDNQALSASSLDFRNKYEGKTFDMLEQRFYKWDYTNSEIVRDLFRKIPFAEESKEILEQKPKIRKEFVHKKKEQNILISDYFREGMVNYFKCLMDTEEIIFDHHRDHVEGILLFEIIRQAGIASTHLGGLNMEGIIVISNTSIQYRKFIVSSKPFYIRTISINRPQGGTGFFVYEIFQEDEMCVSGWFDGISFINNQVYEELKSMVV